MSWYQNIPVRPSITKTAIIALGGSTSGFSKYLTSHSKAFLDWFDSISNGETGNLPDGVDLFEEPDGSWSVMAGPEWKIVYGEPTPRYARLNAVFRLKYLIGKTMPSMV